MADQAHVQVGDVVEVIPSEGSSRVGVFYYVGDRGMVISIDEDGDPWVDFSPQGNPDMALWCHPEELRVIARKTDIYAKADKLEGRLALAEAQRDQLLEAARMARLFVLGEALPTKTDLLAALECAIAKATGA